MFVARKQDGSIYGAWMVPQTEQQRIDGEDNSPDWLADDDAELVAFLSRAPERAVVVSRLRFKLELRDRRLGAAVEAIIGALPGPDGDEARLYWVEATEFESDHPLVLAIGALLDPPLSPSDIRTMFEAARDRAA